MMDYLITAIVFIVVFTIVILVHEFGHFIMAKRSGIKVEEFGIGLPPRITGKKKGETIYSINWIPIGGFVRMLGEDSSNTKMLKNKRSFIAQPMRSRVKVVIAGVMMNFILAWILLSIGFTAGMQPLLGPDDVFPAVSDGTIELAGGMTIVSLENDSVLKAAGMKEGDRIYEYNGELVNYDIIGIMRENRVGIYSVYRGEEKLTFEITDELLSAADFPEGFQAAFKEFVPFPRTKIFHVDENSNIYNSGLRAGDIILQVNGTQIYSVEQFEDVVRGEGELNYLVYRDGQEMEFFVELNRSKQIVISRVLPGTPAEEKGLMEGDIISQVNGRYINDSKTLVEYTEEHADEVLGYTIIRNGKTEFYEIRPRESKVGVMLSELIGYGGGQEMSLYNIDFLSTIENIKEEKYPVYQAVYKSFGEMVHSARVTGEMFLAVIFRLVTEGELDEGVAGPVGIAQMTHIFTHEGFIPLLRFVAIISLSLGVINILPFPALDGGRLLFIIIEFILGRKVNQKWEAMIHALGYVLIILFILAVTYSDILRIINS